MNTLKIGDRVKYIENSRYLTGMTGCIRDIVGDNVYVCFYNIVDQTLNDWWVHRETLEKIS